MLTTMRALVIELIKNQKGVHRFRCSIQQIFRHEHGSGIQRFEYFSVTDCLDFDTKFFFFYTKKLISDIQLKEKSY